MPAVRLKNGFLLLMRSGGAAFKTEPA